MKKESEIKVVARNKKASFNYFLSEPLECGLELYGTEIKSIRDGGASLSDSYVLIRNGEAYILNMHISPYKLGTIYNKDPLRDKKLLMHKKEIIKYAQKADIGGYTIVPTKLYLKNGKCKVEIALGKGKKLYDKREDIKKRDVKRDIDNKIKSFNY